MIIRCKYSKLGDIAFVSHLDLLRIFIRALRRESIRLNYSQGFHPHPKLSFSPALSLGVESICEYLDMDVADEISPQEVQDKLNKALPRGVEILESYPIDKMGGIATLSTHSRYEFSLDPFDEELEKIVEEIAREEYIPIRKKNKKGKLMEINAKDRIEEIFIRDQKLYATLLNSVNGAMKPSELLEIIDSKAGKEYDAYQILKKDLYFFDGKGLKLV
ncbi:MAG: TIGR03936 family radical SAM-associated protein [Peptostreptococcaceae bacterium]|nr:TIGR03936 family radical SAM-associated protein [Peptostreptococcaceae bacterium]